MRSASASSATRSGPCSNRSPSRPRTPAEGANTGWRYPSRPGWLPRSSPLPCTQPIPSRRLPYPRCRHPAEAKG
eukprot:1137663-Pleurochrysis_carterae.AAC.1